jgi:hypothetical protein
MINDRKAPQRKQRTRLLSVGFATTSLILMLAACDEADGGSVDEQPETEASPTLAAESKFVVEIDPEACPAASDIPSQYAAPEHVGYREEFTTPDFHETLSCAYWGAEGYEALDGVESILLGSASVDFILTEGPSPWTATYLDGDLNFDEYPAASYFEAWHGTSQEFEWEQSYSMESSKVISFSLFTSLDNLYVNANLIFVVPDEIAQDAGTQVPKAEIAAAAYEILDVLVPPVVDGLERE